MVRKCITADGDTYIQEQENGKWLLKRANYRGEVSTVVGSVPEDNLRRDEGGVLGPKLTSDGHIANLSGGVRVGYRIVVMEPHEEGRLWRRARKGIQIMSSDEVCEPFRMQNCYARISASITRIVYE